LAARDRQCDRAAGVLPDGLILSSIAVGIAPFTGWKGGGTVFATASLFMSSGGLKTSW